MKIRTGSYFVLGPLIECATRLMVIRIQDTSSKDDSFIRVPVAIAHGAASLRMQITLLSDYVARKLDDGSKASRKPNHFGVSLVPVVV